jgi:hypothetical protein
VEQLEKGGELFAILWGIQNVGMGTPTKRPFTKRLFTKHPFFVKKRIICK